MIYENKYYILLNWYLTENCKQGNSCGISEPAQDPFLKKLHPECTQFMLSAYWSDRLHCTSRCDKHSESIEMDNTAP